MTADTFYPRTIRQVRAINRDAGGLWFEPDTMAFFNSRIHDVVYAGRWFVSGETFEHADGTRDAERYTVRELMPDGRIETVGEFQQYAYAEQAHAACIELARDVRPQGVPVELCVDCVAVNANGTDDLGDDTDWEGFLPTWDGWIFGAADPDDEPHYARPGRPCGGCGSGLGGDRFDYVAVKVS